MGEFNSDDHYIYYGGQESLGRNGVAIMVNERVQNAVLGCNLKNDRMISVRFQGKPFSIMVIQAYAPTSNAEEAEVANKGTSSQSYGFSSNHIWMSELDHKESWEPKNWCFWTVVLEKTLESPLDCKEIKPVNLKGNQSWVFIGNTDAKALATWCEELTHLKRPWCWERLKEKEKGTTEDEMVGWHHWLNGHEFKQALGVGDGQGSLACCSPWGHEESEMTERLNWTDSWYIS